MAAIVARVEQERADTAVPWPTADPEITDVLPVIRTGDAPTEVLPPAPLPRRVRRYVQNPPTPYPRAPQSRPDNELMQRVLEGLRNLSDEPPGKHR
ncbi:hypothetical protein [Amycolatopsis sp. H20-H5]|uniref:hypothetical protein n=1 Tax=Amycolatopsis sp. H20-H5 TaxID=3046309 RepID=UPI002DBF6511|nr:hypothetical protein [Amycolatopsis sp. H20-H5]MEC3978157.1 hypothetical protein [Amycolatopsis sp. H20-H5]